MTDLTLVVLARDETVVCGPTIRAAEAAIRAARAQGLVVQPVVALEAPTERTAAYFANERFAHWERRTCAEGEVDRLLAGLDGRYVALLPAGDLCSENWLVLGAARLRRAEEAGERAITHPELTVDFDGARAVLVDVDQGSPLFTPYRLYFRGYHDGLWMAPREVGWGQRPGREVETMAAGWRHVVVADTVHFRRRGDGPPAGEQGAHPSLAPALPGLAIDRIEDLGR